ncbi:MAG: T9SS type A sorting domain-containing protein, partial [Chitinophagales bacterium]
IKESSKINPELIVKPNPFTNHCTFSLHNFDNTEYSLTIFNAQGMVVQKISHIMSSEVTIQKEALPSGFYYYRFENAFTVFSGKLQIQ